VSRRVQIEIPTEKIEEFCRKWKITEFSLFGSVLRDDFRSDSDVDVLITFAPDARYSLFDLVHAQNELEEILGYKVDLVERSAVEESKNYIRRKHILASAEPVYVA
jgi:predicted nucleotidyltransferase